MKVWAYFGADGRVCADSQFQSEDDAWRVMLGWPSRGEVRAAQERGDRVTQIEIVQPPARKNLQHPDAGPRGDRYPFGDPQ